MAACILDPMGREREEGKEEPPEFPSRRRRAVGEEGGSAPVLVREEEVALGTAQGGEARRDLPRASSPPPLLSEGQQWPSGDWSRPSVASVSDVLERRDQGAQWNHSVQYPVGAEVTAVGTGHRLQQRSWSGICEA